MINAPASTQPRMWARGPAGVGVTFGGSTEGKKAMEAGVNQARSGLNSLGKRLGVPNTARKAGPVVKARRAATAVQATRESESEQN